MVIWIIGLSASGKTTLGSELVSRLRKTRSNVVFIDGDVVRDIMNNDIGHSVDDRWKNAQRISKLCYQLEKQGIDVVCAILSLFHDSQRWNRENMRDYKEIYLEASMETLKRREIKGLYKRALDGEIKDVVGVDIPFTPPYAPDITINNDMDNLDMGSIASNIIRKFDWDSSAAYRYSSENRLAAPEKYQYAKYEGRKVLDAYLNRRKETLAVLKGRIERLEKIAYSLGIAGMTRCLWMDKMTLGVEASSYIAREIIGVPTKPSEDRKLDTRQFLSTCLNSIVEGCHDAKRSDLFKLLHRFEVTKRIYTHYIPETFRRGSSEYGDLVSYGLFGLCLGMMYSQVSVEARQSVANALLKVNDIIDSVRSDLATPSENYLAYLSISREVEIIKKDYLEVI